MEVNVSGVEPTSKSLEQYKRIVAEQDCLLDEYRQQGQDLTQLVCTLREELSNSGTMAERTQQYIDHISHEFRTPLSVILDYLTILDRGFSGSLSQEQRFLLKTIEEQASELGGMVDDILDIRRLDAGVMAVHRQVVSLDEILKKVVHVLQQKAQPRNVELSIELDADLPAIFVDAEKASRVILNLGMNAIKYCGEPGRVCIAAVPEQDALRVMVTDNGAGIPTADVVKIFQRFYQRETDDWKSTRGFGLGLGIARELVELNFGSIGLSSGPSQGTEFSFTVPIAGLANILRSYSNHIGTHFPNITRVRVYRLLPSTDIKITPKIDSFLCRCLHTAEILIPFENGWLLVSDACMEGKTLDRIQAIIDRRVTTRSSTSIRGLQTKQVFQGRVCDLSSSISGSLRWS